MPTTPQSHTKSKKPHQHHHKRRASRKYCFDEYTSSRNCRQPNVHYEQQYINIIFALTIILLLPLFMAQITYVVLSKYIIRKAYYENQKNKNIIIHGNKVTKLRDYAKVSDVVEGKDGQYHIFDHDEFEMRTILERQRRKIKEHSTLNHQPSPQEIIEKWNKHKNSYEDMLRFGSALCDLDAYVDNSLIRNENGEIIGRQPGVKGWLRTYCPEVAAHYSRAMRCKAMAIRFKQLLNIYDPYPATIAINTNEEILSDATPRASLQRLSSLNSHKNIVYSRVTRWINWEKVSTLRIQAQEIFDECKCLQTKKKNEISVQNTEYQEFSKCTKKLNIPLPKIDGQPQPSNSLHLKVTFARLEKVICSRIEPKLSFVRFIDTEKTA